MESFLSEIIDTLDENEKNVAKFIDIKQDVEKIFCDLIEKNLLNFSDD